MDAASFALAVTGPDCERLHGGALGEPVNALSSLAFVVAGAWIIARARSAPARRTELLVFGLAVAGNGLGGLLFHATRSDGARWVHDQAILAVLLFAAVFAVARLRRWPAVGTVSTFGAALAGCGVLLALIPGSSYGMFAVLGAGAGAGEIAEYRHELRAVRDEGLASRRVARLGVVALAAVAATAFLVGRTGGALCRPESVFQWHAVWHVLAAVAMALYAFAAIEFHPRRVQTSRGA